MTLRYQDWPVRFERALEAFRDEPWRWGFHDCAMFAAHIVEAITGADCARGLRGYKSARGAAAIVKKKGGFFEMIDECAAKNKIKQCDPAFASRGDVVIAEHSTDISFGGMAAGVVGLSGRHVAVAAKVGWIWIPIETVLHAWKVD